MSDKPKSWRPTASHKVLAVRAKMLGTARRFFLDRNVMEVETPSIVSYPVTDRHLSNVGCQLRLGGELRCYLHTSPEFHMKRLLASGAPDVYQICKVYRDGELGAQHLPEFTLIEWYRIGKNFAEIILETCELISLIAAAAGREVGGVTVSSYAELFAAQTGLDLRVTTPNKIRERALELLGGERVGHLQEDGMDKRDFWLDLLMAEYIQPRIAARGLFVVERYPASQASLARLCPDDPAAAERFEVFLDGIELANGYAELIDVQEQQRRFEADIASRRAAGRVDTPMDPAFLAGLEHGLPECSGVAVGFDRVAMAALGLATVREVVAFTPADL